MSQTALQVSRATIAHHSKSFALASKVLPPSSRDDAAVVYTWCRRADDAIDLEPPEHRAQALARLRAELDQVYGDGVPDEPVLAAFQEVVQRTSIPREYPDEMLAGMEMDVLDHVYRSMDDLYRYCYRVASTVGLMMSHVMGVAGPGALRHAAHLGIAMQITNICRDVVEDWDNQRLYLPDELLERHGAGDLRDYLGQPFPVDHRARVALAVGDLLDLADRFYRSGDRGLAALPWRCAFAVRTARRVYAAIGTRLRRRDCDVTAGRAYVSTAGKLFILLGSAATSVAELPVRLWRRLRSRTRHRAPVVIARFPDAVLPL